VVGCSSVSDTQQGRYRIYDRVERDARWGGYGPISMGKAFVVSSNTAFAKVIHENYKARPQQFVDRLRNMGLHRKLDLPIIGEGEPVLRYPGDKGWSGISLAWMSPGYRSEERRVGREV